MTDREFRIKDIDCSVIKEEKMNRNEYDIQLCWDEETKEFDWDEYQYLCDIADYWECEE